MISARWYRRAVVSFSGNKASQRRRPPLLVPRRRLWGNKGNNQLDPGLLLFEFSSREAMITFATTFWAVGCFSFALFVAVESHLSERKSKQEKEEVEGEQETDERHPFFRLQPLATKYFWGFSGLFLCVLYGSRYIAHKKVSRISLLTDPVTNAKSLRVNTCTAWGNVGRAITLPVDRLTFEFPPPPVGVGKYHRIGHTLFYLPDKRVGGLKRLTVNVDGTFCPPGDKLPEEDKKPEDQRIEEKIQELKAFFNAVGYRSKHLQAFLNGFVRPVSENKDDSESDTSAENEKAELERLIFSTRERKRRQYEERERRRRQRKQGRSHNKPSGDKKTS